MHPAWLRCSSFIDLDITRSSRLASRAPRRPKTRTYSFADPKGCEGRSIRAEAVRSSPFFFLSGNRLRSVEDHESDNAGYTTIELLWISLKE